MIVLSYKVYTRDFFHCRIVLIYHNLYSVEGLQYNFLCNLMTATDFMLTEMLIAKLHTHTHHTDGSA